MQTDIPHPKTLLSLFTGTERLPLPWILVYREVGDKPGHYTFRGVFTSLQAVNEAVLPRLLTENGLALVKLSNNKSQYPADTWKKLWEAINQPIHLVGPDQRQRYQWNQGRFLYDTWYNYAAEPNVPLWQPLED